MPILKINEQAKSKGIDTFEIDLKIISIPTVFILLLHLKLARSIIKSIWDLGLQSIISVDISNFPRNSLHHLNTQRQKKLDVTSRRCLANSLVRGKRLKSPVDFSVISSLLSRKSVESNQNLGKLIEYLE